MGGGEIGKSGIFARKGTNIKLDLPVTDQDKSVS